MVRSPCCDGDNLKKGPWTPEEDERLVDYISRNGRTNWKTIPKLAGLSRCGKSCRLRWTNYLRPDIKRGKFTDDEERLIINLHSVIGNKWSRIATHLPGRTDNEIKNFWNTHIRKKLLQMGIDPITHKPRTDLNHFMNLYQLLGAAQLGNKLLNPWDSNVLKLQADDATQQLARLQVLQNLLQIMNTSTANHTNTTSLLGSQNLTNPVQGLLGATNFYPTDQPHTTSKPLQFLFNPCGSTVNPQAAAGRSDDLNAVMNSWAGESDHLSGGLQIEDSSNNNILSSFYNIIAAENELPELVLASTAPETSIIDDQMRRKFNNPSANNSIIGSPTTSTAFEDWEKLIMDDNETDASSYWKDILDFTSSPPSPI